MSISSIGSKDDSADLIPHPVNCDSENKLAFSSLSLLMNEMNEIGITLVPTGLYVTATIFTFRYPYNLVHIICLQGAFKFGEREREL